MIECIPIYFIIESKLVNNIISSLFVGIKLVSADDAKLSILFDDLSDIINKAIE
jgi:hypothetical protein